MQEAVDRVTFAIILKLLAVSALLALARWLDGLAGKALEWADRWLREVEG